MHAYSILYGKSIELARPGLTLRGSVFSHVPTSGFHNKVLKTRYDNCSVYTDKFKLFFSFTTEDRFTTRALVQKNSRPRIELGSTCVGSTQWAEGKVELFVPLRICTLLVGSFGVFME